MLLLALACATSDGTDSADPVVDGEVAWYGDVEPIVTQSCAGCHVAGGVGGFALDTFESAAPMAEAMAAAVETGRMPPWDAAPGCNTYRGDLTLDADAVARLRAWADAGAPAGDAADSAPGEPPVEALDRVDVTLSMPEAYTPNGATSDDYRCFLVDWPVEEATYVTGYRVVPGNAALVHHVIAYIASPLQVEEYQGLDDAEAGVGWTCYGGPGLGDQSDAEWMGSWAPGGSSGAFPNGTGIKMKSGSKVVLQVHYNTAGGDAGSDLTSVEVMTSDDVDAPAYIQPWTDPTWLDGTGMDIPAGSEGTEHSFTMTNTWSPFQVHTASMHMHQLGRTGGLEIEHADGSTDCLVDVQDWDFNWQRTYVLAEALTVEEGDKITVRCTWDNPTEEDINWGEGTGDEMCLGTMLWSF